MQIAIAVIFILAGIAADQWVKHWCVTVLAEKGTIPLWENVFHLTYAENKGAGFSILSGQRWFLIAVTSAVLIAIIIALIRHAIPKGLASWGAYCVISGAVGNLIDRIRQGYVVDLFDFRAINFAIFNVADILVCVGAGLFALWAIIGITQEDHAKKKLPETRND